MRKIRDDLLEQVQTLLENKQAALASLQVAKDSAEQAMNELKTKFDEAEQASAEFKAKLDALPWDYDKLLEICNKIKANSTIMELLGL